MTLLVLVENLSEIALGHFRPYFSSEWPLQLMQHRHASAGHFPFTRSSVIRVICISLSVGEMSRPWMSSKWTSCLR